MEASRHAHSKHLDAIGGALKSLDHLLQAFCDANGEAIDEVPSEDQERLEFELDKKMRLFYRHTSGLGHQCASSSGHNFNYINYIHIKAQSTSLGRLLTWLQSCSLRLL